MNIFKQFNPWHVPTIAEQLQQELYNAKIQLLQHQTQLDYYTNMVKFNQQRIQRLVIQQHTLFSGDDIPRGTWDASNGTAVGSTSST